MHVTFAAVAMPELTGPQFLQIIDKKYQVVLTTAYTEFALEAYEHNVVTCPLAKPIAKRLSA